MARTIGGGFQSDCVWPTVSIKQREWGGASYIIKGDEA